MSVWRRPLFVWYFQTCMSVSISPYPTYVQPLPRGTFMSMEMHHTTTDGFTYYFLSKYNYLRSVLYMECNVIVHLPQSFEPFLLLPMFHGCCYFHIPPMNRCNSSWARESTLSTKAWSLIEQTIRWVMWVDILVMITAFSFITMWHWCSCVIRKR